MLLIQSKGQCELITHFVHKCLDTFKHFPCVEIWRATFTRKYARTLRPHLII